MATQKNTEFKTPSSMAQCSAYKTEKYSSWNEKRYWAVKKKETRSTKSAYDLSLTCRNVSSKKKSALLYAYDFGFNIPSTATIDKIVVYQRVCGDDATGYVRTNLVKLKTGASTSNTGVGNNVAQYGYNLVDPFYKDPNKQTLPSRYTTRWKKHRDAHRNDMNNLFYGYTDKTVKEYWGVDLTPDIVNNSNFGVVLQTIGENNIGHKIYCDVVEIEVYYTDNGAKTIKEELPTPNLSYGLVSQRIDIFDTTNVLEEFGTSIIYDNPNAVNFFFKVQNNKVTNNGKKYIIDTYTKPLTLKTDGNLVFEDNKTEETIPATFLKGTNDSLYTELGYQWYYFLYRVYVSEQAIQEVISTDNNITGHVYLCDGEETIRTLNITITNSTSNVLFSETILKNCSFIQNHSNKGSGLYNTGRLYTSDLTFYNNITIGSKQDNCQFWDYKICRTFEYGTTEYLHKTSVDLSNTNLTVYASESISFDTTVTSDNKYYIPEGTITAGIYKGTTLVTSITNTLNGSGKTSFEIADLSAGSYNLILTYNGTDVYSQCVTEAQTVTIKAPDTTICTVTGIESKYLIYQDTTYTVQLSDTNSTPITNATVDILITNPDGTTQSFDSTTNSTGELTENLIFYQEGTYTIKFTYDGTIYNSSVTSTKTITVTRYNTKITAWYKSNNNTSLEVYEDQTITVRCKVEQTSDNVNIIDDRNYGVTLHTEGYTKLLSTSTYGDTLEFTFTAKTGMGTVYLSYVGDDKYSPTTNTLALTVKDKEISIFSLTNTNDIRITQNAVFSSVLSSDSGVISGEQVTFSILSGNTSIYSTTETTSATGEVNIPYVFDTTGTFTVRLAYAGSVSCKACTLTKSITVNKMDLILNATDVTCYVDEDVIIPVAIDNGSKIMNERFTISLVKVNETTETLFYQTVTSKTSVDCDLNLIGKGVYTATINYAGNKYYNSVSTSVIVTVKLRTAYLLADDVSVTIGNPAPLNVTMASNNDGTNVLSDRVVKFYIATGNLKAIGQAYTENNGRAGITYNFAEGTYNIVARFEGDSVYDECRVVFTVTVTKPQVTITDNYFMLDVDTFEFGNEIDHEISVTNENGILVDEGVLNIYHTSTSELVNTYTLDGNIITHSSILIPANVNLTLEYIGENTYADKTIQVTVPFDDKTHPDVVFEISNENPTRLDDITINVSWNDIISNESIQLSGTLSINGTSYPFTNETSANISLRLPLDDGMLNVELITNETTSYYETLNTWDIPVNKIAPILWLAYEYDTLYTTDTINGGFAYVNNSEDTIPLSGTIDYTFTDITNS